MAVHLYGQMVDMEDVAAVTGPAGVALVEDAAQAHGATLGQAKAGSLGVAAGFSFYPGKNLGAFGDGGAVTTSNSELQARIDSMANHGRSSVSRYHHERIGRNSRLDGLQARLLSIKLAELDKWNAGRRNAADAYRAALPDGFRPITERNGESVYHLFVVETDICLLYTSPSPRDATLSRMPSSA